MVVDGELHEEEEAAGELGSPASMADVSSCKWALADKEMTAVLIPSINSGGGGQGWRSPANRDSSSKGTE
jgi:hypothetical protein